MYLQGNIPGERVNRRPMFPRSEKGVHMSISLQRCICLNIGQVWEGRLIMVTWQGDRAAV